VGIIGDRELAEGVISLKDMRTGDQNTLPCNTFTEKVKELLKI
jgi:histidyl-tRNA synthetase